MVDIKFEMFEYICSHSEFKINGIDADLSDFGQIMDLNPSNAPDYGCGNLQFVPYEEISAWDCEQILLKYDITVFDIPAILNVLIKNYNFGHCELCQ